MPDISWTWAPQAGRYRGPDGRFLSDATIRAGVDALVQTSAARMADLSRRFRAGELTASAWLNAHMAEIRSVQIAAALAAYGGRSQMNASRYGVIGQIVRREYAYARRMAQDVLDGRQRMNGRLDVRAASYATSAIALFENTRRANQIGRGAARERNVVHASESCSGCRAETARGLVPIGTLTPIGARYPCGPRCRCSIAIERAS